jgi:hypothetical protein
MPAIAIEYDWNVPLAIAARKNALALAASKGWWGHISRSLELAMHAPREGAIVEFRQTSH